MKFSNRLVAVTALVIATTTIASAQAELVGPDQYPQLRGLSGLPGGGFPISPYGGIRPGGAFAHTTPVAYHLGHYQFAINASFLSTDGAIPPWTKSGGGGEFLQSNGTLVQLMGLKAGATGDFTFGNMIVSSKGDNGANIHFRFRLPNEKYGVAVGIQDIAGQIGSAGDTIAPEIDYRLSRSAFVVFTTTLNESTHLSVGTGTRRFQKGFANASTWITPRLGTFIEFEGSHWNGGLMYGFGDLGFSPFQRNASGFMTFGTVRGKYPFWSVGVAF